MWMLIQLQMESENDILDKKRGLEKMERCPWCLGTEKMIHYHDEEWGWPVHDDRKQFEFLMLEALQCGLSWNLMIEKWEIFRVCFSDFDYDAIASYAEADVQRILNHPGMIRSPRKIQAIIHNARCFQEVRREFGSFDGWLWSFTQGKTILYDGHAQGRLPAANGLSDRIAKELKRRGFKYLGSITVYAHLQACGIVNDHLEDCFRYTHILQNHPTRRLPQENER